MGSGTACHCRSDWRPRLSCLGQNPSFHYEAVHFQAILPNRQALYFSLHLPLTVYAIVYVKLELIMYDWDEKKNARNKAERQLDFNDAEQVFNGPTLTFEDSRID